MIEQKYHFISYNGIREARLNAMIQKSKETQQTLIHLIIPLLL